MLHVVSTVVLMILAAGVYFRRRPEIHMKLMTGAFVIDLALVLYIELARQAVESVVGRFQPLAWTHAGISLVVLLLYVAQIVLGRRLLLTGAANVGGVTFAPENSRRLHRNLGVTFLAFRVLNYVTAFMV